MNDHLRATEKVSSSFVALDHRILAYYRRQCLLVCTSSYLVMTTAATCTVGFISLTCYSTTTSVRRYLREEPLQTAEAKVVTAHLPCSHHPVNTQVL